MFKKDAFIGEKNFERYQNARYNNTNYLLKFLVKNGLWLTESGTEFLWM
jgi:hypothetical protein